MKKLLITLSFLLFFSGLSYGQSINTEKILPEFCKCPDIEIKKPVGLFFPDLGQLIEENIFFDMTRWKQIGGKFDDLFYKDYRSSHSSNLAAIEAILSVVSPKSQIKFIHPDQTYTINLTPCQDNNGFYSVPIGISYRHPVMTHVRDFDYKNFKYTTREYVDLLLDYTDKKAIDGIEIALKLLSDKGPTELNSAISVINNTYQTQIPFAEETYRSATTTSSILDTLKLRKVELEDVLTKVFILSTPGIHKPDQTEEDRLVEIFFGDIYRLSFEEFSGDIVPNIDITFSTQVKIEISSNIIKPFKKKEVKEPTNTEIWGIGKHGRYTSSDGVEATLESVCVTPLVISGTNVQLSFTEGKLISGKNYISQSDYLLQQDIPDDFSGLLVEKADLKLVSGADLFEVTGSHLLINNKLISGSIIQKLTSPDSKSIWITVNGKSKATTIVNFLSIVKKSGLKSIRTEIINDELHAYFKK